MSCTPHREVIQAFAGVKTPAQVRRWMGTKNPMLGNRTPNLLIKAGDVGRVLALVARMHAASEDQDMHA